MQRWSLIIVLFSLLFLLVLVTRKEDNDIKACDGDENVEKR